VEDIADTLRTLVGGEIVGTFRENDDLYDVWLRAEPGNRSTQEALEDITLRLGGTNTALVQLANVVNFREARGPNQIDRYQRQRKVTIVANLAPDKALGDAMQDVQESFRELNLPPGYSTVFTGRAKTLQETGQNFPHRLRPGDDFHVHDSRGAVRELCASHLHPPGCPPFPALRTHHDDRAQ
jgi:multidrug efflux pump subunit AcrB